MDQINTLRIIIEQSQEYRSPLYLTFVDFERAFDTLLHSAIWNTLLEKGVPDKIVNIIKALYKQASCRVVHKGKVGEKIAVMNGVKQGCVLSPLLFNIVLDSVLAKTNIAERGIRWSLTTRLEDLDYADDICFLSHTFNDMREKLKLLAREAEKVGLKINIGKTKEMRINTAIETNLHISDQPIERVNEFVYIVSVIDHTGDIQRFY